MKILSLIKSELSGFGKAEKIIFPTVILVICIISLITNDNKIALISSLCGICYTVLAGKGRISCYFIGIIGTVCYSYIAFSNNFYAQSALNLFYYLPMEILGIFKWRKHLKKDKREIIKTSLGKKEKTIYSIFIIVFTVILTIFLQNTGDKNPFFDSSTTVLSIAGQFLTVKRCIEQWYIWFLVNVLSMIMWIIAYVNGSNCLAAILMWFIYIILSIYFLRSWKKELAAKQVDK